MNWTHFDGDVAAFSADGNRYYNLCYDESIPVSVSTNGWYAVVYYPPSYEWTAIASKLSLQDAMNFVDTYEAAQPQG